MKKIIIRVVLVFLGLLLIYTVFNQFDAGVPVSKFTPDDLLKPVYSADNGFYKLWSLSEPDDVDVTSTEVFSKYDRLCNPAHDTSKFIEIHNRNRASTYLEFSRARLERLKEKIPKRGKDWTNHPEQGGVNWIDNILLKRDETVVMGQELAVWTARYQKLIDSTIYVDNMLLRFDAPIPNLLAWLITAKYYNIQQMMLAVDGNWEEATTRLLAHTASCKRMIKGSHVLINNLVGKAVLTHTLRALGAIMERKECPKSIYRQIFNGLPPITYLEYGSHYNFIAEIFFLQSIYQLGYDAEGKKLSPIGHFFNNLFLQKNRTAQIAAKNLETAMTYEETPPYLWKTPYTEPGDYASGWFWWLQNPSGKILLDSIKIPNFANVTAKSNRAKAYYDMTRIAAELNMNYTPELPVEQILSKLDSYKTIDDCSGRPYRWNEQKQLLYSIGINKKDDGGTESVDKLEGDYIFPCTLFVKPVDTASAAQ